MRLKFVYDINKYCKNLELDKILNMLSEEATTYEAKEAAIHLSPSTDFEVVKMQLKQTEDAYLLETKYASPSFVKVKDAPAIVNRAKSGAKLSIHELLSVAKILTNLRNLKSFYENYSNEINTSVDNYFELIFPNKYLEDKINNSFKNEEEINDNASPQLSEIRRKIKSLSSNIRTRFEKILRDSAKNKYLQENIVTQRDGRYVIPVKAEHRGEFPGLVHDISASGATVFVEPMIIVELNNEMRVLMTKEKIEEERIITELSGDVSIHSEVILNSYELLTKLDLIFAKSSLAFKMMACMPKINRCGKVYLKNARHPLIDKKKIVPITVSLGDKFNSLIITGPNTGGKTVTLKTIGLLTVMTMCGLMIPADDNSEIAVFDKILVDIGDEQSIELSLSTFSSHMVNIINIINNVDNNSLVLLDELGGGTDPIEGAALARSILQNLHNKGTKIVATTHYSELKAFAIETDGVENACFEFDIDTLKPTYKLMIGVPGKSNAFEIAKSLGLDVDIINVAKNSLTDSNIRFDELADSLEKMRREIEKDHEIAAKTRLLITEEKNRLQSKIAEIDKKKEQILDRARRESENILYSARQKSDQLLNDMEDLKKQFSSENSAKLFSDAKRMARQGVNEIEDITNPVDNASNNNYILPRELVLNDNVIISDINKNGVVLKIDKKNNKAYVSAGNINVWVDFSNLRLIDTPNVSSKNLTRKITRPSTKDKNLTGEIDIRGFASDEGVMEVDRYIDSAILSGIETITIIHGKGTGVLRNAVHSHLRRHKNVDGFRVGTFGEGENGVTIVTLKK